MKNQKWKIILSLIILIAVIFHTENDAIAMMMIKTATMNTLLTVPDYGDADGKASNIGGISVGPSNNRLYVLKTRSANYQEEKLAVLFYYSNIYEKKTPKKILFANALLGHANAMAIDENYLYVTMWQAYGPENFRILKISRKAVSNLKNEATVKSVKQKDPKGNIICQKLIPKSSKGGNYQKAIRTITKYQYDKENHKIQFIINYDDAETEEVPAHIWKYTIAELDTNTDTFTVSEEQKDIFSIKNTTASYWTKQDIFYQPEYGLFIPLWSSYSRTINVVYLCDINALKYEHQNSLTFEAKAAVKVNGNQEVYSKYEIESLAYVKANGTLVFSCNAADNTEKRKGTDRIEEIINTTELLQ